MGDLGFGDVGEDICEPGLRIDIVELGGLDEGVGDRRGLTAAGRADDEVVLSPDRQGSDGALRGIIIELGDAVVEPGLQLFPPRETIAHRCGKRRLAG